MSVSPPLINNKKPNILLSWQETAYKPIMERIYLLRDTLEGIVCVRQTIDENAQIILEDTRKHFASIECAVKALADLPLCNLTTNTRQSI